jgi:2-polyprenyl-3-methyl-5-hydroxy-6-metoxy-1,4-benzoquinol methylase
MVSSADSRATWLRRFPKISCRRCKQSVKTPDSKPSSCTLKNMYNGRRARYVTVLGLHKPEPLKILDLGCGSGYFLAVAKHLGFDAIGVDRPSKESPVRKAMMTLLSP